jgi:hypothetical protein
MTLIVRTLAAPAHPFEGKQRRNARLEQRLFHIVQARLEIDEALAVVAFAERERQIDLFEHGYIPRLRAIASRYNCTYSLALRSHEKSCAIAV